MQDQYLFLWAQWGILNEEDCRNVLEKYGNFENAWHKVTPDFLRGIRMGDKKVSRLFEIKRAISFESIMDVVQQLNIKLYFMDDEDYPHLLKEAKGKPPFLWVRGNLPSFHKSISVVGTRSHTTYGKMAAKKFTADLVRQGFTIVSGLALGIDSFAHKTAVEGSGVTVAVFGTGVDEIYPSGNYRLAHEILNSGGALVSAYPLGTKGLPHHFADRNFIIAALTQGTLVIEGGTKSGALITAKDAVETNREVFAVPAPMNHYSLSGTNKLIRNGKAKLVESVDHILNDFHISGQTMKEVQDFEKDELTLLELLAREPMHINDLCQETEFDIPKLSSILMELFLKNAVVQVDDDWTLT